MASVDPWVDKAEQDWSAAVALNRRRKLPIPDIVCFHCQQRAEKYLKALLAHWSQSPPKIHDLLELLDRCVKRDPLLGALRPLLEVLNMHAVASRYPGLSTTIVDARKGVDSTRRVRRVLRKTLGL